MGTDRLTFFVVSDNFDADDDFVCFKSAATSSDAVDSFHNEANYELGVRQNSRLLNFSTRHQRYCWSRLPVVFAGKFAQA